MKILLIGLMFLFETNSRLLQSQGKWLNVEFLSDNNGAVKTKFRCYTLVRDTAFAVKQTNGQIFLSESSKRKKLLIVFGKKKLPFTVVPNEIVYIKVFKKPDTKSGLYQIAFGTENDLIVNPLNKNIIFK